MARIHQQLEQVQSLDQDRIIRSYLDLILATNRTSFYQREPDHRPKSYVALKLDPTRVAFLPEPRPTHEIFVYSPRFEGVHLRFAAVARGGLRWSDRRDDFRTEILGLVKAQAVKNAVIVPGGAKGGFVLKRNIDDREARQVEAETCYRKFISGLLDVTDNLVDGEPVPPPDVVCHDDPDPYLVVAADKGTATFSDLANEVSREYGFWLGDAFASGGSAGYDHKKMGITARGAWESVKRHFRELGRDTQAKNSPWSASATCPATCSATGCCCPATSGWSPRSTTGTSSWTRTRTPATSYEERERLFALPRSRGTTTTRR